MTCMTLLLLYYFVEIASISMFSRSGADRQAVGVKRGAKLQPFFETAKFFLRFFLNLSAMSRVLPDCLRASFALLLASLPKSECKGRDFSVTRQISEPKSLQFNIH